MRRRAFAGRGKARYCVVRGASRRPPTQRFPIPRDCLSRISLDRRRRRRARRPLALGSRLAAAAPRGRGRRSHDGRRRVSPRLRGHGARLARRFPERAPTAAGARAPHRAQAEEGEARRDARRRVQSPPDGAGAARPHARHAADTARGRLFDRVAPRAGSARRVRRGVRRGGEHSIASLRELLGIVGAHEWRKKGVPIAALGGERIHPHYGVFSPVRGEYVALVARAPLPSMSLAFEIGVGTGVLAAVLASRGVGRIVATDQDKRARLRGGERRAARLCAADRDRRSRSVSRRACAAHRLQSAVGARAAELAARIRGLRSGQPDAEGLSRRARRASRAGR